MGRKLTVHAELDTAGYRKASRYPNREMTPLKEMGTLVRQRVPR